MRFSKRTAIVTGGASGIGAATVHSFLCEGAGVLFIDIDRTKGEALQSELGPQCAFFHGSVSDENACAASVAEAERQFGRPVTYLVNNAFLLLFRTVEEATADDWRKIVEVNLVGCSLMSKHAAASIKKGGGGAIVNLSSISGLIAQAGTMTYNATKAALLGMTRCMALDLGKHHIRVNAICPGYTTTPSFFYYLDESGLKREETVRALSAQTILGRLATPEDIAGCILFLCSDDAAYITGTYLMVDGGLTAL